MKIERTGQPGRQERQRRNAVRKAREPLQSSRRDTRRVLNAAASVEATIRSALRRGSTRQQRGRDDQPDRRNQHVGELSFPSVRKVAGSL